MPRPWRMRFAGAKYHCDAEQPGGVPRICGRDDRGAKLAMICYWPVQPGVPMERILDAVAQEYRTTVDRLCGHGRAVGEVKKIPIELCCHFGAASQRAVAIRFGYKHESAVGKQRQLLRRLRASEPSLEQRMIRIAASVSKF